MNGEEIAKLIDRDHEVERLDRGRERDLSRWAPARCGCRSWQINPNRGWQQVMCGHQLSPPKNSGGESYSDGGGCARRCESSCNSLAYPLDGRVSDLAQFAKVFEILPAWHTLAREVRPTGPARGATPVEFIILGPTALCVKGQRIDLGAAKQRGILGILLYHAGEPVRIDLLVEQLWDDGRSLDDYRANLYALASRIRAALNRVGMGRALVRLNSMPAYRLDVDPNLVDFHRFKRMVAEARQAAGQQHHDTAAALLARATALWTDVPLADLRGAHAEHLRRDMYDAQLEAHKLLAECQLKIGQHQSVLAGLEPFMRTYRLDETLPNEGRERRDSTPPATEGHQRLHRTHRAVDPARRTDGPGQRRDQRGGAQRNARGRKDNIGHPLGASTAPSFSGRRALPQRQCLRYGSACGGQ